MDFSGHLTISNRCLEEQNSHIYKGLNLRSILSSDMDLWDLYHLGQQSNCGSYELSPPSWEWVLAAALTLRGCVISSVLMTVFTSQDYGVN